MAKLWRCMNQKCQATGDNRFSADQGVCPKCGLTEKHPKFGHVVQRLPKIHFDPPSEVAGYGKTVRACDETQPIQAALLPGGIPTPWHQGTGNVYAVTCPECKETLAFKEAMAFAEDDEDDKTTAAALGRLPCVRT